MKHSFEWFSHGDVNKAHQISIVDAEHLKAGVLLGVVNDYDQNDSS